MKKFIKKLSVFLFPFFFYVVLIMIIDPFGYYRSNTNTNKIKKYVASNTYHHLWVKINYDNAPCENIILGNSRAACIKTSELFEWTGVKYFNMGFNGGNLNDIINAFWYANDHKPLKNVYIGVDFSIYNGLETNDRFSSACEISSNTFTYSFNRITLKSVVQYIEKNIQKPEKIESIDKLNKDDYWKYKLDIESQRFFSKYVYPDIYHKKLHEIYDYCKAHNINLVFFIPPDHVDWKKKIEYYGLKKNEEKFLRDINELGTVYDFSKSDDFNNNRDNFNDPVHIVNSSVLIHKMWAKKSLLPNAS